MTTIDELVKKLEEASHAYYNGIAIMSDAEFDALHTQLSDLAPDHPFLKQVGAPETSSAWEKRTHTTTMLSQDKVNIKEEWEKWAKKMQATKVALSLKLDGATIVLTYKEGELQYAVTRGTGFVGDDITKNVLKMQGVRPTLNKPFTGDIRGEVVLPLHAFETYFEGYENPRNSVNAMKNLEDSKDLVKHFKIIAFEVVSPETNGDIETEEDMEEFVKELGLEYVTSWYLEADQLYDFFKDFEKNDRSRVPYLIDGMIARIYDIAEQKALGFTSHHPKGSVALKFEPEGATPILKNVTWQAGLAGRHTPVAEFDPIPLGGVTVRRATLHNPDFLQEKNVEIGDKLFIERAGDVIPKVIRVLEKSNSGKGVAMPTHCLKCEGELIRDGAYLMCENDECAGKIFGDMVRWCTAHRMFGFGRARISELVEAGIDTPDKLYTATQEEIAQAISSFKIADKFLIEINKTREIPLNQFLTGLHIKHLGKSNGKRLMAKFGTLEAVLNATELNLQSIPKVGATTAKAMCDGLVEKRLLIDELLKYITILSEDLSEPKVENNSLEGKSFCMTQIRNINDQPIAEMIVKNGGKVKSGVSKGLDYLIVKDKNHLTGKLKKALALDVVLLDPEDFLEMLG
jgi:DNA ligase (NAD+)